MSGDVTTSRPGPGRPRNDRAGPALLAAARELVVQHGYEAVSVAAIAKAAGTGRQTLYRRWPSKAELILDAFTDFAVAHVDSVTSDPVSTDPVRDFLLRTFHALGEAGPALRSLMAHAQRDPTFCTALRERFIAPRRASLRAVLEHGQAHRLVPAELDLDAAVSALYGALWYRLLLSEPLDLAYATALSQLITQRTAPARPTTPSGTSD